MSDEDRLKEINESLKEIANSLKPKKKKQQLGITIAWIIIGIMLLYMLYDIGKMF